MKISNLFFAVLFVEALYVWTGVLAQGCIPSGTDASINAALTGVGSSAILCASAIFTLNNHITFTANNQQIYTIGLPAGSTRAILRITGSNLATAINGQGYKGTVIKNIEIDGNRPALGRLKNGGPNIAIGNAWNQVIDNVFSHDSRGWSCMSIVQGSPKACHNTTISNNQVGPAGNSDGTWADGISLDCIDSVVTNNVITDATDGAIAIFGSPGSIIKDNTIIASKQILLGGINMVEYPQYDGSYLGTQVLNNTINAQGAFIKSGIAMGSPIWARVLACPASGTLFGAIVSGNTLTGAHFGYGYPVNGVSNWTVTRNVDNARHVGKTTGGCSSTPDRPACFQYQSALSSTLQSECVSASLNYILGVTEPSILAVIKSPTYSACGKFFVDEGLIPGQTQKSCDRKIALTLQPGGNLVLMFGAILLWQTSTSGQNSAEAIMQADGNFVMYNSMGNAIWSTGTGANSGSTFSIQNDGNLVVYSPSGKPLWSLNTAACGYLFVNEMLIPGQTRNSCDGRFTLMLQSGLPSNGHLVLLFGSTTLWQTSQSWQTSRSGPNSARAVMQSDGNFVMYDNLNIAVWSTGTAGNNGAILRIQNDGNLVLYSTSGRALWNTVTCCH